MKIRINYDNQTNINILSQAITDTIGEDYKIHATINSDDPFIDEKATITKENASRILHDLFPEETPKYVDLTVQKPHIELVNMIQLSYISLARIPKRKKKRTLQNKKKPQQISLTDL